MLDKAKEIRKGEELDKSSLVGYCKEHFPELPADFQILQFPSGYSNLTYLIKSKTDQWVLRRPPYGANIKGGHDMAREFKVLSGLKKVCSNVPTPLLLCTDESVLGAPFYIMERVQGIIIRERLPPEFQEKTKALSESAIDNLATIHRLDIDKANLADLGRPIGYVERQIGGWTRRYGRSKTDDIKEMDIISHWLEENRPPEISASIIHNDYKYDNLVLDPQTLSIKAVLDWEMATIGCPLMDLGCALGYWVQQDDPPEMYSLPLSATRYPGTLTRKEAAERYSSQTGFPIDNIDFYMVYGLWRLAVIIQQIYARYNQGHTQDPRFSSLIDGVKVLSKRAVQVIETGIV